MMAATRFRQQWPNTKWSCWYAVYSWILHYFSLGYSPIQIHFTILVLTIILLLKLMWLICISAQIEQGIKAEAKLAGKIRGVMFP